MGRPKKIASRDYIGIIEVKCPKCGKIFCPAPYHAYKDNGKLYCSWTCFNHRKDKK